MIVFVCGKYVCFCYVRRCVLRCLFLFDNLIYFLLIYWIVIILFVVMIFVGGLWIFVYVLRRNLWIGCRNVRFCIIFCWFLSGFVCWVVGCVIFICFFFWIMFLCLVIMSNVMWCFWVIKFVDFLKCLMIVVWFKS